MRSMLHTCDALALVLVFAAAARAAADAHFILIAMQVITPRAVLERSPPAPAPLRGCAISGACCVSSTRANAQAIRLARLLPVRWTTP